MDKTALTGRMTPIQDVITVMSASRLAVTIVSIIALLGCRDENDGPLRISVASSMYDVVSTLASRYESTHSDLDIVVNYGASSTLARQIVAGARVDLFISADRHQIDATESAGMLLSTYDLVGNQLVLVGRRGIAQRSNTLSETLRNNPGRIAIGANAVPAGVYARQWLTKKQLLESNRDRLVPMKHVRQVVTSLRTGNVALGFIYATDAAAFSAQLEVLAVADKHLIGDIVYPIAVMKGANKNAVAFVDWMRTDLVINEFKKYGFTALP